MRALRLMLLLAAAAAVFAMALSAASASSGDPAAGSTIPDQKATTPIASMPREITDHFRLFRDQLAAAMPPEIERVIASSDKYGRNARFARSISTPNGTGWVIPGDGYICLAVPDPVDGYGESCVRTSVALERGVWLRLAGDAPDSRAVDTIVVPDGAKIVSDGSPAQDQSVNGVVTRVQHSADSPISVEGA